MQEKALVIDINKKEITVLPLLTDACLSCKSGCAKQGKPFTVTNPSGFKISKNSVVKIDAPKSASFIQGITSLLLPIVCAVLALIFSPQIALLLHKECTETLKVLLVLTCFFVSCAFVFLFTRIFPKVAKPVITQVE
jgi:hypothetical protein